MDRYQKSLQNAIANCENYIQESFAENVFLGQSIVLLIQKVKHDLDKEQNEQKYLSESNKNAYDRLDQSHSAWIERMFWIGCSTESSELKELLEEWEPDQWEKIFPECTMDEIEDFTCGNGDIHQIFIDKRKMGLLAECRIPNHYGFSFDDDGDVRACSVGYAQQSIFFAYGETREELLQAIEKQAEEIYQQQVAKEKVA